MGSQSSELAMKDYAINTVIASVVIPPYVTFIQTIRGYREMPKIAKLGSECAVVIEEDVTDTETRVTFPRSDVSTAGGDKQLVYAIQFTIHAVNQDAGMGSQFDALVAQIRQAFRDADTGIFITDPLTTQQTWLHAIGERMRGRRFSPEQIAADGAEATLIHYKYRLEVEFKEWIQD